MPSTMHTSMASSREMSRLLEPREMSREENLTPRPVMVSMLMMMPQMAVAVITVVEPMAPERRAFTSFFREKRSSLSKQQQMMSTAMEYSAEREVEKPNTHSERMSTAMGSSSLALFFSTGSSLGISLISMPVRLALSDSTSTVLKMQI